MAPSEVASSVSALHQAMCTQALGVLAPSLEALAPAALSWAGALVARKADTQTVPLIRPC